MDSPRVSTAAIRWFARYNRHYLARHFAGVRVAGLEALTPALVDDAAPLVVYMNHAAWWDPLVGTLLATGPLAARRHRAVIDVRALERYALLERLGFVGLDRQGADGARSLLRLVDTLCGVKRSTLWLTPQGRFTDPRTRPIELERGLGHIARRLPGARFLPVAIEYPMGGERLPEVRVRIGEPESPGSLAGTAQGSPEAAAPAASAADLTARFAARLTTLSDRLADDVMHDRQADYVTVLSGRHGVGAVYDLGRRIRARITGRAFDSRHGGNLPTR